MSKRSHRVVCGVTIVKQKRQACAAFLGVLTISINVVSVCCILTTILRGSRHRHGIRNRKKQQRRQTGGSFFANQLARENTTSVAPESPRELQDNAHETAAAGDAAALRTVALGRRLSSCG